MPATTIKLISVVSIKGANASKQRACVPWQLKEFAPTGAPERHTQHWTRLQCCFVLAFFPLAAQLPARGCSCALHLFYFLLFDLREYIRAV